MVKKLLFAAVLSLVSICGYSAEGDVSISGSTNLIEVPAATSDEHLLRQVMELLPKDAAAATWDGKYVSAIANPALTAGDLTAVREIGAKDLIGVSFGATLQEENEAGINEKLPKNVLLLTNSGGKVRLALGFYKKNGANFVADPETAKAVQKQLAAPESEIQPKSIQ